MHDEEIIGAFAAPEGMALDAEDEVEALLEDASVSGAFNVAPPVYQEIMGYYPGGEEVLGGGDGDGADHEEALRRVAEDTRATLARRRDKTPPAPLLDVTGWDEDSPCAEIDDAGAVTDPGGLDEVASRILVGEGSPEGALPLAEKIYRKLADADSGVSVVRLDTPETYRDFRAACSPEMAALEARVAELEDALAAHTSDGHGGRRAAVIGLAADVSRLQAAREDKRVPLQLPPFCDGKVDCWREGDAICCSIALPGPDGDVRICTSATPVAKHVEDAAACASEAGASVADMLGVLPTIACMMGGGALLTRLCGAAPAVLARPEACSRAVFVGKIVPRGRPVIAALAALCQLAQAGSSQARGEWQKLALASSRSPGLGEALRQARAALCAGQARKAAGRAAR